MANPYLQDSSFWILSHRRGSPSAVIERAATLIRSKLLAVNEVVRIEVLLGYKNRDEFADVAAELDGLPQLDLSRAVWSEAADLGFGLKRRGVSIPVPYLLIAATAIHYDSVLLHADSDFELIAQHSELRTESYLEYLEA